MTLPHFQDARVKLNLHQGKEFPRLLVAGPSGPTWSRSSAVEQESLKLTAAGSNPAWITMDTNNSETFELEINLYLVRSQDGKFLRAKKHNIYGGHFDTRGSWTDKIQEAKIYTKPGPARSQVTFWSKNYPTFGIPDIVIIEKGTCRIVNETKRVKKAINKALINSLDLEVRNAQWKLDRHMADVRRLRGDGKDATSLKLSQELEYKKKKLEEANQKQ